MLLEHVTQAGGAAEVGLGLLTLPVQGAAAGGRDDPAQRDPALGGDEARHGPSPAGVLPQGLHALPAVGGIGDRLQRVEGVLLEELGVFQGRLAVLQVDQDQVALIRLAGHARLHVELVQAVLRVRRLDVVGEAHRAGEGRGPQDDHAGSGCHPDGAHQPVLAEPLAGIALQTPSATHLQRCCDRDGDQQREHADAQDADPDQGAAAAVGLHGDQVQHHLRNGDLTPEDADQGRRDQQGDPEPDQQEDRDPAQQVARSLGEADAPSGGSAFLGSSGHRVHPLPQPGPVCGPLRYGTSQYLVRSRA